MDKPEETSVHTWQEITSLRSFEDLMGVREAASFARIYRGVSKNIFDPIPKVGRPEETSTIAFERACLDKFIREARPHLNYEPKSRLEWMILGQHYGLPTRLLDWTTNMLVALYFACQSDLETPGAIYSFSVSTLYDLVDYQTDPFELKDFRVIRPVHLDHRIVAQKGLFTIHAKPTEPPPWSGVKYVVSPGMKKDVNTYLKRFGVNRASLFPGLDSLTDQIAEECQIYNVRRSPDLGKTLSGRIVKS